MSADLFRQFRSVRSQSLHGASYRGLWGESGGFLALFGALALVDGGAGIAAARTITTSGMLRPVGEVTVGSNVSGMVLTVTCEANATVKKGQSCAKIDPRPFEIAVENSRASIAMATAQLES